MERFNVQHLPLLLADKTYLGLLSYELLNSIAIPDSLKHFENAPLFKPAVHENDFPYKAIELMANYNLSVLPILNESEKLIANINEQDLFLFLTQNSGLSHKGGIIVLHIKPFNYSLAEIARICETNDVLILNVQIKETKDNEFMQVIIKTNTKDLSAVLATFERYEYDAFAFGIDNMNDDTFQKRYDMLMKFLNI